MNSLEIKIVSETEKELSLQVPTYRVDVQRDVDVIEDLLRIYGYNHVEISDRVHSSLSYKTVTDQSHQFQNLVSEQLTGCGFNEIMNNSLTCGAYYDDLQGWPRAHCVALLNPLSNDLNVMRQTLLFGGLESISHNINRRRANLRFTNVVIVITLTRRLIMKREFYRAIPKKNISLCGRPVIGWKEAGRMPMRNLRFTK